jgi:regulator of sirC expression with transglutaminase-like and TPR domain
VGLPGHFVVRHVPAEGEPQLIDVFESATTISREEAERRLKENTEREPTEEDFRAAGARAIIARMLHNLLGLSGNDPKAMHRYLNAILAVEETSAQHRALRAMVRYRLEDLAGAAADVEWLLDNNPDGIDVARLRELQRAIQARANSRQ